jgi:hypothetical protein
LEGRREASFIQIVASNGSGIKTLADLGITMIGTIFGSELDFLAIFSSRSRRIV